MASGTVDTLIGMPCAAATSEYRRTMTEHDDIKKRFGDKLKARQAEGQQYRVEAAQAAEAAFDPIIRTVKAMAEAVSELGDPKSNIMLHSPAEDDKGDFHIKVFFNQGQTNKQIVIRLAPAIGHGDQFWIAGLDLKAAKQLDGERPPYGSETVVSADRGDDVGRALETCGETFFGGRA